MVRVHIALKRTRGGSGLGVDLAHVDGSVFRVSIRPRITSLAKKSDLLQMGI